EVGGIDLEGEVEVARVGFRRIARLHLEEVEAEVADGDERMLRALGRLVLFVLAAAAADLAVEDVAVELHRALPIGDDEREMIHALELHDIALLAVKLTDYR